MIRERRVDDVAPLTGIAARVAADGYPPHRPAGSDAFIVARNEISAFVSEVDGEVVGQVAAHEHSARAVMEFASARLALPVDSLATVARLFVDPRLRRGGIGRALLDHAAACIVGADRFPVLDVWEGLPGAIKLYESAGWNRIGTVTIEFGSSCTDACVHDGNSITSFVFAAPRLPGSPPVPLGLQ